MSTERGITMNKMGNISIFFSLSLLFLFASLSLLLVYAQIQSYQDLNRQIEKESEFYTPISYITHKVQAYDEKDAISVVEVDSVPCLKLKDEKTITLIFQKDGKLQELYALDGIAVDLNASEAIMPCDSLDFSLEKDQLVFTVNKEEMKVKLHCEESV